MNIPKDLLAEKNYSGSRLIKINNPVILKLKKELTEFQKKANPTLKKMEEISKLLDPTYSKIAELNQQITKLKEEIQPTRELYDVEMAKVELIDQRAQLVKNKIQPLIEKEIEGQLGEFEKALQATEKNNLIFVEVVDELEETVKKMRASKLRKK